MIYEVTADGASVLAAWGPPFTLRNAEELVASVEKALPKAAKRPRTFPSRP